MTFRHLPVLVSTLFLALTAGGRATQQVCQSDDDCKCSMNLNVQSNSTAPPLWLGITWTPLEAANNGCCNDPPSGCTTSLNCTFSGDITFSWGLSTINWTLTSQGGTKHSQTGTHTLTENFNAACETQGVSWCVTASGSSAPFTCVTLSCEGCAAMHG